MLAGEGAAHSVRCGVAGMQTGKPGRTPQKDMLLPATHLLPQRLGLLLRRLHLL